MKKIFILVFFLSIHFSLFAQGDGGRPSYSTGGSNASNLNTSSNSSSGSTSNYQSPGNSGTNTYDNSYSPTNRSDYNTSANYNTNDRFDYNRKSYIGQEHTVWYVASTFYARVGFGYAFPTSGQTLNENGDPYSSTMNFDDNQQISSFTGLKKVSFSLGLQATGAFGWMVNKNIGIELDGYLGIAPTKYSANFNGILVDGSYPANITVTNKAVSPIFIAPCILLQTSGKKWRIYARSGPVIPANGKVQREEVYNFYPPGYHSVINQIVIGTRITNTINIGFTAATGLTYKLNKNLSLWSELSLLSISLDIKQEINTANVADGQSASNFPTVNYGVSGTNVNRYNQTGTQPTYAQPFSNIAWNAGIAYGF